MKIKSKISKASKKGKRISQPKKKKSRTTRSKKTGRVTLKTELTAADIYTPRFRRGNITLGQAIHVVKVVSAINSPNSKTTLTKKISEKRKIKNAKNK